MCSVTVDVCSQRLGQMSYFGGIERQHEGVYVPDLGSLTSLHDRQVTEPLLRVFGYLPDWQPCFPHCALQAERDC